MNGIVAAGPSTIRLVTAAAVLAFASAYLIGMVAVAAVLALSRKESARLPFALLAGLALIGAVVCGAAGLELLS